jgi:hypothetical protein
MRKHDKPLYCESFYVNSYTPILCCDFLRITRNFKACGTFQDSRIQFSPLGWLKKVLIMFPTIFSLLFYWFRWVNSTKNIYRFLLISSLFLNSSLTTPIFGSGSWFVQKLRSEGACCPPTQNPLYANYDLVVDEPQLSYYLVPPWWPSLNEISLMYIHM